MSVFKYNDKKYLFISVSFHPSTLPGRFCERVRDRHLGKHARAAHEEGRGRDPDGGGRGIPPTGGSLHVDQSCCRMGNTTFQFNGQLVELLNKCCFKFGLGLSAILILSFYYHDSISLSNRYLNKLKYNFEK